MLTADMKRRIHDLMEQGAQDVHEEDASFLHGLLRNSMKRLDTFEGEIKDELKRMLDGIDSALCRHLDGSRLLPDEPLRSALAAVHYFINPYDLIPDNDLDNGFLDDHYFLSLTLERNPDLLETPGDG